MGDKKFNEPIWMHKDVWQPSLIGFVPSKKAWKHAMKYQLNNSIKDEYPGDNTQIGGAVRWYTNPSNGHSIILIVIRNPDREPVDLICTLVHECVHVWQFAKEAMGEKEPGIEIEAYAIDNIFRWLLGVYTETVGKGVKWNTKEDKK